MVQKSLQVLVLAALLALATIVVYASLSLHGPDETIAEAKALAARGERARAITTLGLAERDVRGDNVRTAEVLRLRSALHTALGRYRDALADVRRLAALQPDDVDVRLDEIRLLALDGDGPAAERAAEEFLRQNPGHGRGLELAGEAAQTGYQPLLREVMGRLQRELPATDRDAAREAAWSLLYRPDQDPEIESARQRLAALHGDDPRLQTAWPGLDQQLGALRREIQRTLDRCRGSLEASGAPVAAFRAVALALDQSGRLDDLLAQCEIHRRRFAHHYVDEAGAAAAWALLRTGQHQAVVATAARWLPEATLDRRIAAQEVGQGTLDLLVARAVAGHRLGDRAALLQGAIAGGKLWPVLKPTPTAIPIVSGFHLEATDGWKDAEDSYRYAFELLSRQPAAIDRVDVLPEVAAAWLRALAHRNAPEAERQNVLHEWTRQRPGTLAPLLAAAELQSALGRPRAAAGAFQDALAVAPMDDAVFERCLAARRAEAADEGRDGAALLQQMIARRTNLPEVKDPMGYVLCAEAALAINAHWHAGNCARAAIDAFPRARTPHLLHVRCLLASGAVEEAVRVVERLLAERPAEPATVALGLAAFERAGRAPTAILARAMTTTSSPRLQAALLTQALADAAASARVLVDVAVDAADAEPDLQLAGATALARAGELDRARTLLARALPRLGAEQQGRATAAVAAWLAAAATNLADDALAVPTAALLQHVTASPSASGPTLGDAAARLLPTHPRTAALAAERALDCSAAADRRGVDFVVAGRAAARLGQWRRAEERWTAALAFPDGSPAAEGLAALCLLTGRSERAQEVLAAAATTTSVGLAARLADDTSTAALVAAALSADPADLLAHCALALRGQPSLTDWRKADGELAVACQDVLVGLHDDALAGLVLPQIKTLFGLFPTSTTNALLLARALAVVGRADEAAALHAGLAAAGASDLVFLREVARAAAVAPNYVPAPAVCDALYGALLGGRLAASPPTLAYAVDCFQGAFRKAGFAAIADQIVATGWQLLPPARPLEAQDVAALAGQLPPLAAMRALVTALQRPPQPAVAQQAREKLAALAGAVTDPAGVAVAAALAREQLTLDLAAERPHGGLLHFVLANDATIGVAERTAMLRQHVAAVAAAKDVADHLPTTVAALAALTDAATVRQTLGDALDRHPTSLPVWLAWTRARIAAGDAAAAIADLGAAMAHGAEPALQLEQLVLAGEARQATPAAAARLAQLPADLLASPLGRYAQGLFALRTGQPDAALPLLTDAPPRPDGMHLFALALAALQAQGDDGPAQAHAAFTALVRDYPSSSLARNAGRFASQLALR